MVNLGIRINLALIHNQHSRTELVIHGRANTSKRLRNLSNLKEKQSFKVPCYFARKAKMCLEHV